MTTSPASNTFEATLARIASDIDVGLCRQLARAYPDWHSWPWDPCDVDFDIVERLFGTEGSEVLPFVVGAVRRFLVRNGRPAKTVEEMCAWLSSAADEDVEDEEPHMVLARTEENLARMHKYWRQH
jgi:hypothetical protein